MTLTIGLTLALLCSLVWVCADGLRKKLSGRFDALELAVCLHWWQLPILAALAALGPRLTTEEMAASFSLQVQPGYWWPALPTIVCNAAANALFVRALQLSDLSLCIPYLSLTPVMAMFTAWLVVGEIPTALGMVGVLTVGIGALVLNPGDGKGGGFHPIRTLMKERGSLMMLGVGALWSFAVAFDKASVALSSPLSHGFILATTGGAILEGLRRRNPSGRFVERIKKGWLPVAATTAAITIALFLQLATYKFLEVSYAEAIKRSIGLIGSVVVGWLFFKEKNIAQRLLGVTVMAAGVCLILFAAN